MSDLISKYLFGDYFSQDWHMQPGERAGLLYILQNIKPKLSIEIGTFKAGSLRPISKFSDKAISFDIAPSHHLMTPELSNVEFVTGDTAITLPPQIEKINSNHESDLEFILIDGSHEAQGVISDINNCLCYKPKRSPCFILLHDTANPGVRHGVMSAAWLECDHFHGLDVDYVPGQLYSRPDIKNEIWGGGAGPCHSSPRNSHRQTNNK